MALNVAYVKKLKMKLELKILLPYPNNLNHGKEIIILMIPNGKE